jgi:hypothetical protein
LFEQIIENGLLTKKAQLVSSGDKQLCISSIPIKFHPLIIGINDMKMGVIQQHANINAMI